MARSLLLTQTQITLLVLGCFLFTIPSVHGGSIARSCGDHASCDVCVSDVDLECRFCRLDGECHSSNSLVSPCSFGELVSSHDQCSLLALSNGEGSRLRDEACNSSNVVKLDDVVIESLDDCMSQCINQNCLCVSYNENSKECLYSTTDCTTTTSKGTNAALDGFRCVIPKPEHPDISVDSFERLPTVTECDEDPFDHSFSYIGLYHNTPAYMTTSGNAMFYHNSNWYFSNILGDQDNFHAYLPFPSGVIPLGDYLWIEKCEDNLENRAYTLADFGLTISQNVIWTGTYIADNSCDQHQCCCLSGAITVTENDNSLLFEGQAEGQCSQSSSSLAASTPSVESLFLVGQLLNGFEDSTVLLKMENNEIRGTDLDFPECTFFAAKEDQHLDTCDAIHLFGHEGDTNINGFYIHTGTYNNRQYFKNFQTDEFGENLFLFYHTDSSRWYIDRSLGSDSAVAYAQSTLSRPVNVVWKVLENGDFTDDANTQSQEACDDCSICDGFLCTGQRVQLTVSNGPLAEGSFGTAVLSNNEGGVVIEWDGFTSGHNGNGNCECSNCCWTVACSLQQTVDLCEDIVCEASDDCHLPGKCDSTTGECSNPQEIDGVICDDGTDDTVNDICVNGVCTGMPVETKADVCEGIVCLALDECHVVGDCNVTTGICSNPFQINGLHCDDKNDTTNDDICSDGVCTGVIKTDLCATGDIGNGRCDQKCNDEEDKWDGGDCCENDCVDGIDFQCGSNGFHCLDPNSSTKGNNANGSTKQANDSDNPPDTAAIIGVIIGTMTVVIVVVAVCRYRDGRTQSIELDTQVNDDRSYSLLSRSNKEVVQMEQGIVYR